MRREIVAGLMLIFLISSTLASAFNVQLAEASGTIYIRANGLVEGTNKITTTDNVTYSFTDNINDTIVIERSNIIVNGKGYTLQRMVNGTGLAGFYWFGISNVTIKNTNIKNFDTGIYLNSSSFSAVSANNLTDNSLGIHFDHSSLNTISENQIKNNINGVYFSYSSDNTISGNNITANNNNGIYLVYSSSHNSISENNIEGHNYGVSLYSSGSYNVVSGNNIENNWYGISVEYSSDNNTISGNNIKNNSYGIYLHSCLGNSVHHNDFINNSQQANNYNSTNIWDNGYPSGGNYWSDYAGDDFYAGPYQNETVGDGIGDINYTIAVDNVDHYPLMSQWILNTPSHMVVAYLSDANTLDPARGYDTSGGELIENVYEPLIFFDKEKTDQFVPRLATKWLISADGLNYIFTIRQGVKFHNNEVLTTEDVEYSLERLLVIEGGQAWMFYEAFFGLFGSRDSVGNFTINGTQIDNAITRDSTTVTLHLAKPFPALMQILSQPWASILCKKWCIGIGDWPGTWNNWTSYNRPGLTAIEDQNTDPPGPRTNAMCGTGPFMLDYYQKGVEWSIMKFDSYWGGWPASGSDGFLQQVTSKKISYWETRKNWFLEGELDYVQVPDNVTNEVLGQPGISCIYPVPEQVCYAMFFTFNINVSSPYLGVPGGLPRGTFNESGIPPDFFSDVNVRKGFAYAFDYSKLIEEELGGEASQPATPIISGLPFYNPAQEKYSLNLTKAAECFKAAWNGSLINNGFNFTICYREANLIQKKTCEIIKANVENLSNTFHIQIQPLSPSVISNHEVPIFQNGWLADFADPHDFVYGFMYSNGPFPEFQNWGDNTIDDLAMMGIATMNETARRGIYYELQRLYHEECPSVPLYQPIGRRFQRNWVQGWYYNPSLWGTNYYYVQWKGNEHVSNRYPWPMFRHDSGHSGYADSPAPNTNQTEWTYATGDNITYNSPAVADGKVYIGSLDAKVYCLDSLTGTEIWNYSTGRSVYSSPAVADGKVYVGSLGATLYCLDASTGAKIWNSSTGDSVYSSPAVADGKVYVSSLDNRIYCFDALNGVQIWNYSTGNFVYSSPAVAYGKVYVGSSDRGVYCLDALNGERIWNCTTGSSVSSSPAVADGKVYVGSLDCRVYCFDALNGVQIWNSTTGNLVNSSPAVAYGKVYIGAQDAKVYCFDAFTGAQIWNSTTGGLDYSSPAVADGKVYIGSLDHKVYCFDAFTGANIWNYATGQAVNSSPAVADGVVFVGSNDKNVYAFGSIIRVPEDYKTIQEAIDVAPSESTILISPGTYHESLVINKTLTIIGRMGSEPIFDGGGSGVACFILLPGASGSTIAGIVITNWKQGILFNGSSDCDIFGNIMSVTDSSVIALEGTNVANNRIYNNIFQDSTIAINLTQSSSGNVIYSNIITGNDVGINLSSSSGNIIYHNNFVGNIVQVYITMATSTPNTWDAGYPSGGNYWSDKAGVDLCSGINQAKQGSDGIFDTNYTIATNNVDRYPLTKPFNPHDIGIKNVMKLKTVIGQGFTLSLDIEILNCGTENEISAVTVYANSAIMATQTATLMGRTSTTITFSWNTAGFAKGNYTICAYACPVSDETETLDNTKTDGWVIVARVGDITGLNGYPDGKVNMEDVGNVARLFGVNYPDTRYNPNCDIDDDGKINMVDIGTAARHFGETDQ